VIDKLGFTSFGVEMLVSVKLECELESRVQCSMSGCEFPPREE